MSDLGRIEPVTRQTRIGQKETVEYFLHSSHSHRITIANTDMESQRVGSARSANSIALTGRSGEQLLGATKEADLELNHLGVLRTQEMTG